MITEIYVYPNYIIIYRGIFATVGKICYSWDEVLPLINENGECFIFTTS